MQNVALLGLGTMGAGMARNLIAKGFALSVWNRTPARAAPLAAAGARIAASLQEAARDADVVLAMVADDAASRGVWLGPTGALGAARRGAVLIESSTLTPGWIRELAASAEAAGCGFLDAPVGGSRQAAASEQLVFFVGGETPALEAARPVLSALGARINHLGPVGAGATWKLVNNMLVAAQSAALAEAYKLARKAGFSPEQIQTLLLASAAASPIVQAKLPRMAAGDYEETDFALYLMRKDAGYAAALAQKLGVAHEMIAAAGTAFARAEAAGFGAKDFAAVAEA